MMNIQFNLRVPGCNRFRNIMCRHGILSFSHYKFWEIQVYKSSDIIDLFLRITTKQSHAGIATGIGFLGFNIEFQIYDSRHWDKNSNTWMKYDSDNRLDDK